MKSRGRSISRRSSSTGKCHREAENEHGASGSLVQLSIECEAERCLQSSEPGGLCMCGAPWNLNFFLRIMYCFDGSSWLLMYFKADSYIFEGT